MNLPLTFSFIFTNKDLQASYQAQLDYVCKPSIRYILIAAGGLAFFGPIITLLCRFFSGFGFIDVFFIIIGAILLRAWAIAPAMKRRRIMANTDPAITVRITMDEDSVTREREDFPKNTHSWDEIIRITDQTGGFLMFFNDGQIWWLPSRIFSNQAEQDDFMNLAARKGKLV